jgi:single-strand DNA-binding protein
VADPELRHTPNGAAVATFRLAVDRDFKSKNPDEPTADFVNIVAWRNSAEFVSRYFSKGRMALVEGRLQIRNYNDKEGNRRSVTEVVADSIHFCDSKRDSDNSGNYGGYAPSAPAYNPPATPAPSAPASNSGSFADLEDDGELPF